MGHRLGIEETGSKVLVVSEDGPPRDPHLLAPEIQGGNRKFACIPLLRQVFTPMLSITTLPTDIWFAIIEDFTLGDLSTIYEVFNDVTSYTDIPSISTIQAMKILHTLVISDMTFLDISIEDKEDRDYERRISRTRLSKHLDKTKVVQIAHIRKPHPFDSGLYKVDAAREITSTSQSKINMRLSVTDLVESPPIYWPKHHGRIQFTSSTC